MEEEVFNKKLVKPCICTILIALSFATTSVFAADVKPTDSKPAAAKQAVKKDVAKTVQTKPVTVKQTVIDKKVESKAVTKQVAKPAAMKQVVADKKTVSKAVVAPQVQTKPVTQVQTADKKNLAKPVDTKKAETPTVNTKTDAKPVVEKKHENKDIYHRAFKKHEPIKFNFSLPSIFKKKDKPVANTQDETPVKTLQGGIVMTIDDCVNFALKHDPNIKIYEDTQKAQKSLVGQAKSNYFPSIFAGTGYNINNTQYSRGMNNSINNNYFGIDAGVSEMIWDFGKTAAKVNMTKYNYEAAGYDLAFQIAISAYNVRFNYTAVLAKRANEGIYALNVKIQQLNYERTKAMYDVGLKSKIDVVNAQANLTQARIDLLQAQNDYQTALIALNNSMTYFDAPEYSITDTETFNFQNGYSVKNELDVAYDRKNYDDTSVNAQLKDGAILTSKIEKRDIIKTYKLKPYTTSLADSIKLAYEHRPDYKSAQLVVKAQEQNLKAIKRLYYPSLNASAQYNMGARSDYTSNAIGIYGGIDFPTINAMNIKYQIDQGKALLDRAINNEALIKKNVYFAVQKDYVTMKQYEKTIPLKSQKVYQALENFELADGRYAVGLGNYIELQTALKDYNNAQLDFVTAVFNYNYARYTLGEDMGIFEGV